MRNRLPLFGVMSLLAIALGGLPEARSMPILMDDYAEHPLSVPKYRSQCVICHVHEDGSGALTAFGKKYDRVNFEFTTELVREYGNLFRSADAGPEMVSAHAEPAATVAVPGNEPRPSARRRSRYSGTGTPSVFAPCQISRGENAWTCMSGTASFTARQMARYVSPV